MTNGTTALERVLVVAVVNLVTEYTDNGSEIDPAVALDQVLREATVQISEESRRRILQRWVKQGRT